MFSEDLSHCHTFGYHRSPKIQTPETFAVIILKLEQYHFTTENWSKSADRMETM